MLLNIEEGKGTAVLKLLKQSALYLLFSLYIAFLFYLLFFSAYRSGVKGIVDYNLIPFQTISRYFANFQGFSVWMFTDQFIGNILAFVPFGFFHSVLFSSLRKVGRVAAISFLLSLTVEIAQLIFRVGAFDVDDLILNVLGGVIGFWAAVIVRRMRLI